MDPPEVFTEEHLEPLQNALKKFCCPPGFMSVEEWNLLDYCVQENIRRIYKVCNVNIEISEEGDKMIKFFY